MIARSVNVRSSLKNDWIDFDNNFLVLFLR